VGWLIGFGRRLRSGLSGLQDNQIISNIHNHKQKQNCQKFDIKTQSQTQQTQTQTQTHFLSRSGEIRSATKIQEITRSNEIGNHSRRKQSDQVSLPQAVASPSSSNPDNFSTQASFFSFSSWQRHGHRERERVREGDGNERRERDDQVSTVRLRKRKNCSGGVGTV
jgi:hypothetical protein